MAAVNLLTASIEIGIKPSPAKAFRQLELFSSIAFLVWFTLVRLRHILSEALCIFEDLKWQSFLKLQIENH
jgi:hypothetical protein